MDKNCWCQFPSTAQNPPGTFTYNFVLADPARKWLESKATEIPFATLTLPSDKLMTVPFRGSRLLEVKRYSNGYFVVNSSIRLVSDGVENGRHGTVACKRFIQLFIVNDGVEECYRQGSFRSQLLKGEESVVSLMLLAEGFLAKLGPHSLVRMNLKVEFSVSSEDASMGSTGEMYPVKGSEPPFLASLRSRAFADVTIECEGRSFEAHKVVLSCASTVFARMLETSMVEAATKTIKIDDMDPSTIGLMLDFIYTGNFTANLSDDAKLDLLYCAEKYDLGGLKATTLDHMVGTLSNLNVIKFLNAAIKFNVDREIYSKFTQHVKSNFDSLCTTAEFKMFFAANFDEFFSDGRCTNCSKKQDMTGSNSLFSPFQDVLYGTFTTASTPTTHSIGVRTLD